MGARGWDENFGGGVDSSGRWVRRDDGDGCVSNCRAVGRTRDVLDRERRTQFMYSEKAVTCNLVDNYFFYRMQQIVP